MPVRLTTRYNLVVEF